MKPFQCVEIPASMKHLDRDKRGYPIPVIVFRDKDGRPHFTINNDRERRRVIQADLCSICGQPLFRGRWYVGGPMSAFHENGAYIDPAMHKVCVTYALLVCPYIASPNWTKRIDAKTLSDKTNMIMIDNTAIPDQPPLFVAVMTTGAKEIMQPTTSYFRPRRPYRDVQYWRHGTQISAEEAQPFVDLAMRGDRVIQAPKVFIPG